MACGNLLSQKHSQTVGVGGCGGGVKESGEWEGMRDRVKDSGEVRGCEGQCRVGFSGRGSYLVRLLSGEALIW